MASFSAAGGAGAAGAAGAAGLKQWWLLVKLSQVINLVLLYTRTTIHKQIKL